MTGSFLEEPPPSPQAQELFDQDLADDGFIWNASRLWSHQPDTLKQLFELMTGAFLASGLSFARSLPEEVRAAVTYGRTPAT